MRRARVFAPRSPGGRDAPGTKETTRKASSPRRFEPACSARSMPARRSSGKKREIKWNFPLVLRSAFASTPPTAHAGNFDTEARTGTFAWAMHDAQRCVDATRCPRILSTRKGGVNPREVRLRFRENDVASAFFFRVETRQTRTTPKTRSKSPVHEIFLIGRNRRMRVDKSSKF